MYYSFNVSLLILLKTNRKIAFFDVFVTVLHMVFQRNLLLYSESFVQSKKYEEPEDLSACGFFHHVVPDLQFKFCIAVCPQPYARTQIITFGLLTL